MEEQTEEKLFGHFAVSAGRNFCLTYTISHHFSNLQVGSFVVVPMMRGKKEGEYIGVFLGLCEKPPFQCKDIIKKLEFVNSIPENLILMLKWLSEYYLSPLENFIALLAPSFIWNVNRHDMLEKRLQKLFVKNNNQYFLINENKSQQVKGEIKLPLRECIALNEEQNFIFQDIIESHPTVSLLHGVTGSGKTEVYLKLAQYFIQQNKNVLILVPEIALTPQMTSRFRAVFQNHLSILHSGLTSNEYEKEWFRIHYNLAKVVLGVRTSIFSLLENIALIIVDEEHDNSYKSQDIPFYQARDVAVLRAKKEGALCLLGSATPSVESMYNVKQGKYKYYSLQNKFSNNSVQAVIIDSKQNLNIPLKMKQGNYPLKSSQIAFNNDAISSEVFAVLKETKDRGEQSMVILNRRGYVNFSLCMACSQSLKCPRCSVSTTLHNNGSIEICHYCSFRVNTRKNCPSCLSPFLMTRGIGTQNIEEQIQRQIPELNIQRLDRDVLTSNSRLNDIIENFRNGNTDCLVGTQMLAKGHDFPNVTVVVVLHVEDSLFLPDFRASERTFQLLTQAMGRAGRGKHKGTLLLQSLILGHPVIELSLNNNVKDFIDRELNRRKLGFHPPYSRQILFEIRQSNKGKAMVLAHKIKDYLVNFWKENSFEVNQIRLAGPYFATLEKLNNEFRVQICVSTIREIHPFKLIPKEIFHDKELLPHFKIDVDPYSFM
ncbi:replication restart helicase PriA [Silvanigrella aquatica]|uniref:Replication restart protein PriA n=1 Tax=Silvanigrella aquatica TaxID=1915309 RepID=A0A1L4D112_9BACT|nr:primosomal protein N' [Silvanigrella aquatica]APJ03870.1 primosomal protein N' [Silvanigrella aquatica]